MYATLLVAAIAATELSGEVIECHRVPSCSLEHSYSVTLDVDGRPMTAIAQYELCLPCRAKIVPDLRFHETWKVIEVETTFYIGD